MRTLDVAINPGWKQVLDNQFSASYFLKLKDFLVQEKTKYSILPPCNQLFAAFNHTPYEKIKVVIIGQDPYHKKGQANGLSFSVNTGVAKPPSLVNIFKELQSDLGIPISQSGNLEPWSNQGVLLLNATLTVREEHAASHHGKGWEIFTDAVIKTISEQKKGIVFLLWGRFAHTKEDFIDKDKHFILKAAHPSPLARGAFFGCKHFSKTNKILEHLGVPSINWRIEN